MSRTASEVLSEYSSYANSVWFCALVFGLTSRIVIWCYACFMRIMLVREPGGGASWKVIICLISFCPDVYFIVCFCIS
jgi:hypothetical protein